MVIIKSVLVTGLSYCWQSLTLIFIAFLEVLFMVLSLHGLGCSYFGLRLGEGITFSFSRILRPGILLTTVFYMEYWNGKKSPLDGSDIQ